MDATFLKKATASSRQAPVRFAFIVAEKAAFRVRLLCRTCRSRARGSTPGTRARRRRGRKRTPAGLEIAAIHAETRQRYGSPRIHASWRTAAVARVGSAWRV